MSKIFLKENNNIQELTDEIIKQISAGEVVQNPASVIKELIENSIDANSTEINIIIENGGKSLIKIIDNGMGISKDQLLLSVQNHTTSKIKTLEDLFAISSLGMRGEALFSINSVSNFNIISRTLESENGFSLKNNIVEPCVAKIGTTVIVENLFYNTPARLKFLKSKEYESKLIEEIIECYAVAYPEIQFKLSKNEKLIVYNNPISLAFNYQFQDMIKIEDNYENNIKISGMLLNGIISAKNMIFVNKRLIKCKKIVGIVKKSYQEVSGKTNIAFILFINCPFEMVDVNVHPAKTEIRFSENFIYNYIFNAVRSAFSNCQLIQSFSKEETTQETSPESFQNSSNYIESQSNLTDDWNNFSKTISSQNTEINSKKEGLNGRNFYGKTLQKDQDLHGSSFCGKEIQKDQDLHGSSFCCKALQKDLEKSFENINLFENNGSLSNIFEKKCKNNHSKENENPFHNIIPLCQIFTRYILGQKDNNNMIIIDQHAAHERIISEELKGEFALQKLLSPIILPLKLEIHIQEKLREVLEFEINKNLLIITAIPSICSEKELIKFLSNLENLENPKSIIYDYIHEYGCKNALKTGDTLDILEMEKLIEKLAIIPNNLFCNHGRRILISIEKNKIDKIFGRLNFSDLF